MPARNDSRADKGPTDRLVLREVVCPPAAELRTPQSGGRGTRRTPRAPRRLSPRRDDLRRAAAPRPPPWLRRRAPPSGRSASPSGAATYDLRAIARASRLARPGVSLRGEPRIGPPRYRILAS